MSSDVREDYAALAEGFLARVHEGADAQTRFLCFPGRRP
jgi:hypothetical protein